MGLKLPRQADRLKLDRSERPVSFMPFGFVPFEQFALGNGDVFGFYWPIGREQEEPLVMETLHDGGLISPAFSSLESFLAKAVDPDEHVEPPSLAEDPGSPLAAYEDAREALRTQDFDRAIARLEQAVATLRNTPTRSRPSTCRCSGSAGMTTPAGSRCGRWSRRRFGFSRQTERMWVWLSKQKEGPSDLADDPVWRARAELDGPPGGGGKHNDVYLTLGRAIDIYEEQGETVRALMLMQTYADVMNGETMSFKERYAYVFADWRARQRRLSERLPAGPRALD